MKLVVTLLARDEEDVIACNLDYHLRRGVDFVIATDHGSRDATADILREYERAGVLKLLHAGGERASPEPSCHRNGAPRRRRPRSRLGHRR